jgi:hypothetical protein
MTSSSVHEKKSNMNVPFRTSLPLSSFPRLILLVIAVTVVLGSGSATGTAIYDYTATETIDFSSPWVSVAHITVPSPFPTVGGAVTSEMTSGTGTFTASTNIVETPNVVDNSYTQSVNVTGSAGDSSLTNSGSSFASAGLYNLFTFDFGTTPTDFTIGLVSSQFQLIQSTDVPLGFAGSGESVGGSAGFQAFLLTSTGDYAGPAVHALNPGQSVTIDGLTGIHTFRFGTSSEASATANYPYVASDSGTALGLLVLALTALLGASRLRSFRSA